MAQENRYIILGSGIAGMAAAEAIREKDPEATIRMISAEEELCFNRPMLIRDFALDGSGAVLFEQQQSWPAQYGVEVLLGTKAVSIDRAAKRVRLETESSQTEEAATVPYDKLIYALGAEVTIPPISGAERENVHVVRTREDMRGIRAAMRGAKHAVVIGGGMLGLEDAWALREEKLEVAIIERQQRVAFGQIDQSAGNLMKKRIERMGVPVYVNAQVTEIGDGYVTFLQPAQDTSMSRTSGMTGCSGCATAAVDIATGSEGCPAAADTDAELVTIPADLVILSTGVTPNSALGAKAGLATVKQPPQWIAVDEFCQTSDPNIFAAGDCAAVNGRNDAIWDEAREMGRVAGTNAAAMAKSGNKAAMENESQGMTASGNSQRNFGLLKNELPARYTPVTAEHVFTGFDTEVFTMADSSGAGTDGVYIRHADVEIFDYQRERYIRASLQDGVLAGILLINAPELAPELMDAYARGAEEEEVRQIIQRWKDSHEVDFKPAARFRRR